ncbi:type IV secretion system DNA-binding domain-containing protein [Candidatus Saccharibacteria bacterium]|nr:type IV secretion system DNA-binding domain-containing protein [Candidatus Saccharibacteria bacterium]
MNPQAQTRREAARVGVLIFLLVFLVLVGAGAGFGYFYLRGLYRSHKNYERGLKMVPVLIHLPPTSSDTEASGRDLRDVVDENISKAQVLYSILASTFQKGFKAKFYGQRHIALEIVAVRGNVYFYAAVPVVLLSVVEQAIVSAYPSARLEEVPEHNIFNPVGRLSGTFGGQLKLKEDSAYPIATYQDIKRDTMQSLLNAMSTLTKDDGAGIQILLRPADPGWRKHATSLANNKRKGKASGGGFDKAFGGVGQVFTALHKPPEGSEEAKAKEATAAADVSNLDQSIVQAIEEKTKQPGYEVLIRLVSSSNVTSRAQTILNNLVATFALFDAPGRNGFKFVPAKNIEAFVTAYILRFFPQESKRSILNATELATLFHFPDQTNIPTSQVERQPSKQVDGPRNVPEHGLLLGYNLFRGAKKAIRLSDSDRSRHMYIVGQTGTGKSVTLENLALQDMLAGKGFAFVDPHGDAVERLMAMVPKERTEDIIYFNPGDMDFPMGLNMFEFHNPEQRDFLIQEAINMLYKLYDPQHQGIIGPRYEHLFRNAALTVMAGPDGGSFVDIPKLFRDPAYVEKQLAHVTDQNVIDFWRKEMPQSQRSNEFGDVVSWFVSKFGAFLSNEMMRNIIGQTKSAFNLREIMDEGKILLVNLSRGRTGDLNSKLLGMIFVIKFEAAAMSRSDIPEDQRRDFCLYVDEFQNFSTDSFADILSQARKYHLNMIVANQFTTQLSDEVRDAVFGNVGTVISFRVGTNDAEFLTKQFQPAFDLDDLQFLPNYNTVVRLMIGGVPVQPFSMATLPPLGSPNPQLSEALKQLSAAKYGRPKAEVAAEITKRMSAPPLSRPGFGPERLPSPYSSYPPAGSLPAGQAGWPPSTARYPAPGPSASPSPAPPAKSGSFLDEWLAKRKSSRPMPPAGSSPASSPSPFQPRTPVESVAAGDRPGIGHSAGPARQAAASTSTAHGELKVNRGPAAAGSPDAEHTIHIDQQGNLKYDS